MYGKNTWWFTFEDCTHFYVSIWRTKQLLEQSRVNDIIVHDKGKIFLKSNLSKHIYQVLYKGQRTKWLSICTIQILQKSQFIILSCAYEDLLHITSLDKFFSFHQSCHSWIGSQQFNPYCCLFALFFFFCKRLILKCSILSPVNTPQKRDYWELIHCMLKG